jgi:uncharacterized Zn ribbon protein
LKPKYAHCQNDNTETEEERTFDPEFSEANPFEKNSANDDEEISQGDEIGEELNDGRHVLNGKDEAGKKHHW